MKRLLALLLLSIGLGLGGLYLATREAILSPDTYRPVGLSPTLIAIGLISLVMLWLAPVIRISLLARAQGFRLSAVQAVLAHITQVFGNAMTPSGTGGGPAMLVTLQRFGVPVGTGLGIAIQLFILDLAALGAFIPVGLIYLLAFSEIELPRLTAYLAGGLAIVALVSALLLARFPHPLFRLLHALSRWRLLRRFEKRLRRIAREYLVSAVAFREMPVSTWLSLHLTNGVAWFSYLLLFWALLGIYGATMQLLDVLAVLSIVTLIGFFVPTPGAAGYTELMLGLAIPARGGADAIAAPLLAWRTLTFYIVYLLGPISAWLVLTRRSLNGLAAAGPAAARSRRP